MRVKEAKQLYETLKPNKKGIIDNIQALVLGVIIIAIFLGLGFVLLEEFATQVTVGTQASNSTNDIIAELAEIPDWLGIIILVVIMVGILGLVMVLRRFGNR